MHAAPFIIDSSYIYFTSPFWQLTNDLKEYYYYRTKYKKNNKGSLNPILPEIKYDNEERNNKPDGEEMKR